MPDNPDFELRDGAVTDLPALFALEMQFPGDRLSARQFRHHLRNPRAHLRVLLRDGRLRGYALLLRRARATTARLYSIAVDPGLRGQGAGTALLQDAERLARAAGAERLRLEVRRDNGVALRLYQRAGYHHLADVHAYYDDGSDAQRLEKVLDPNRLG